MNCCANANKFFTMGLGLLLIGGIWLTTARQPAAADKDDKVLRHVVMFQFKEASSEQDVEKVVTAFRQLPQQIPEIADFEYGTNNSPEGLADGFTHCFLVTFASEKDREAYLPHKAHLAFVDVLKPHLEKVMVIDYWATK